MAEVLRLSSRSDPGYLLTAVHSDALRSTIRAAGELDLAARDPLAELFRQQETEGRRLVRLDLSRVTFLDCSCVGVLVAAHRRFLELRGLVVLAGVDAFVARIFNVIGLQDTLFFESAPAEPFRPSQPVAS